MKRGALLLLMITASLTVNAGEYISHLSNIYRAPINNEAHFAAGLGKYYTLNNPNFIGGFGNFIFFSEFGSNKVYRYNTGSETVTVFSNISNHISGNIGCLSVKQDLSFFVCDPVGNKVVLFDSSGQFQLEFSSFGNMVNPIGVTTSPAMDTVLITDGLFDHIVSFTLQALPLSSFGTRGVENDNILHVQDTISDDTGIYVLDKLNKYVKKFSFYGTYIESFNRNEVVIPTTIAVGHFGRIYISDEIDNSIKIYSRGTLVETIGGTGSADGKFLNITDMLVLGPFLYIVDSNNHRIQVFVIHPPGDHK